MPNWFWEIYDDGVPDKSIASGYIENGSTKPPQQILADMIAQNAAVRWTYVRAVEVISWDHDGLEVTTYFLADGERWHVHLRAQAF